MTIETIKAIVAQGAQAFADGKKTDANPHVNNPENHMHWLTGFNAAALAAVDTGTEPEAQQPETEQPSEEVAKVEDEQAEAEAEVKASKKSKE